LYSGSRHQPAAQTKRNTPRDVPFSFKKRLFARAIPIEFPSGMKGYCKSNGELRPNFGSAPGIELSPSPINFQVALTAVSFN